MRVLFLLSCAEMIAKLYYDYAGERKSYKYTRKFFVELCEASDQKRLHGSFSYLQTNKNEVSLSLDEVIRFLYDIRCSLAHGDHAWEFFFRTQTSNSTTEYGFIDAKVAKGYRSYVQPKMDMKIWYSHITYQEFRDIVVRGAIKSINGYIKK